MVSVRLLKGIPKYKILVTGVGAIIGYGIVKSLRQSYYPVHIVGIDIFDDAVGRVWCDEFVQGVRADAHEFSFFIKGLVKLYDIDLIIPGIEQDINALAYMVFNESFQLCKVALNSEKALQVFNNKKTTYSILKSLNLPFIPFIASENASRENIQNRLGFPCVLKPNVSYAGKGLLVLDSQGEVKKYLNKEGFIFQRKVRSKVEYTMSVFGLGDGQYCNPINFKRWLGPDGATHKAEVYSSGPFESQVKVLVRKLKPIGPTNFQFIESEFDGSPLLLEVNPRISASSSMRTQFGVNEPEMCIDYFLENKQPDMKEIRKGRAQRFIDEVVEYDSNSS